MLANRSNVEVNSGLRLGDTYLGEVLINIYKGGWGGAEPRCGELRGDVYGRSMYQVRRMHPHGFDSIICDLVITGNFTS